MILGLRVIYDKVGAVIINIFNMSKCYKNVTRMRSLISPPHGENSRLVRVISPHNMFCILRFWNKNEEAFIFFPCIKLLTTFAKLL